MKENVTWFRYLMQYITIPLFSLIAAGIVIEVKNWPPFFPIIHHDIANEIPVHLQRLQYVALTTFLGMSTLSLYVWFF